jgi:hypothetical protein
MLRESRLSNVNAALTARERAVLVLRSWKEGKDEDPAWRRWMPEGQVAEFNRYIELMNGVNRNLGVFLGMLRLEVEKLSLRNGWLSTLMLWQVWSYELSAFIQFSTDEPVTQAEYDELAAKAREEYVPVAIAAYLLTERHGGFTDGDLDPEGSAHDEQMVRPAAWERVKKEKAKELRKLVTDGVLPGRGKGEKLELLAGPLYDRLGEPPPVQPPWARAYRVVPASEAEAAWADRTARRMARGAFEKGPRAPVVYLPELEKYDLMPGEPSFVDEPVVHLKEMLREGVASHWRELRAVELVVAEAADAFGEDPALPDVREQLDHIRAELEQLAREAERFTGPFALEEPPEETLAMMRRLAER